ncbi:aminopeptidase-like protein 3, partial [Leptotrombidium deliense]
VYDKNGENGDYEFTSAAKKLNDAVGGQLKKQIDIVGPIKKGKSRVFYDITSDYDVVSVVGLGSNTAGYNELEEIEENRENVRVAVAAGLRGVRDLLNASCTVDVDDCNDAEAAAEGSNLAAYYFDELKSEIYKKKPVTIKLYNQGSNAETAKKWQKGEVLANGQNICRRLMELPANHCTPTKFAQMADEWAKKYSIQTHIRDKAWAVSQKMGSFLSVAQGSDEPPVFLEMHYNNAPNTKPIILVGKGITFDSGGISLKPSAKMDEMRADMGGAANAVSTVITLAALKAKVNVIALTPLTENMPSGKATKPGDVFTAMNGKTIQVDNTDAEGRLVLADALTYAHKFDPELIIDIATLTGAMRIALGSCATGVFSTSKKYWELLQKCGTLTGDRVWRMPVFNHFTKQVVDTQCADLNNIGKHRPAGGACLAAAFLKEFVTVPNWMHLDIAGVMDITDEVPYLCKGMAGRPTRTLVEFCQSAFNQ